MTNTTVKTGKTGHNEVTTYADGVVTVVLYSMPIVVVDVATRTVTLDNGGWNTPTTSRHIERALRRLRESYPWMPCPAVWHERGRLSGAGTYPQTDGRDATVVVVERAPMVSKSYHPDPGKGQAAWRAERWERGRS